MVQNPDAGAVKGDRSRVGHVSERPEHCTIAGTQFRYTVTTSIRYPDVGLIEDHAGWGAPDAKRTYHGAVTCAQLQDVAAAVACDPDVGAVIGHTEGSRSHGKGPQTD